MPVPVIGLTLSGNRYTNSFSKNAPLIDPLKVKSDLELAVIEFLRSGGVSKYVDPAGEEGFDVAVQSIMNVFKLIEVSSHPMLDNKVDTGL